MEVEIFRNIYAGKTGLILGSGWSLDYLDLTSLRPAVIIGTNFVAETTPCDFAVCKEDYAVRKLQQSSQSIIIASEHNCGDTGDRLNPTGDNIYTFSHKNNQRDNIDFTALDSPNHLVVSWSTITSAIHLGYLLGLKTIIVAGHDCRDFKGKINQDGYDKPNNNADWYKQWLPLIKKQTLELSAELQKRDCHVFLLDFIGDYVEASNGHP